MNLEIYFEGNGVYGCTGDYYDWVAETPFENFLNDVLQAEPWYTYINMVMHFGDYDESMDVTDYILKNATPEQLERYLDHIRTGISKLYERVPGLAPKVPVKSARNCPNPE